MAASTTACRCGRVVDRRPGADGAFVCDECISAAALAARVDRAVVSAHQRCEICLERFIARVFPHCVACNAPICNNCMLRPDPPLYCGSCDPRRPTARRATLDSKR